MKTLKKQYDYLKSIDFKPSNARKSEAIEADFSSCKEAKALITEIITKRAERADYKKPLGPVNKLEFRRCGRASLIAEHLGIDAIPSNYNKDFIPEVTLTDGGEIEITVEKYKCGYYKGDWAGRPIYNRTVHASIPRQMTNTHPRFYKGLFITRKYEANGYTMYEGLISSFNRADESVEVKKVFMVETEGIEYHSYEKSKLLKGLKKKLKVAEKKTTAKLRLGTVLTMKKYRALTGACQPGCEEFCDRNGLPYSVRMTVEELLKILTPSDWGYDRIKSLLAQ